MLASSITNGKIRDIHAANKVVRFLKAHEVQPHLVFRKINSPLRFIGFSDAAFQNAGEGKSQGGQAILISADAVNEEMSEVPAVLISWHSKKIPRIARSTLAAEILQSSTCFDHASWVRSLFDEICNGTISTQTQQTPLDLKTDCDSYVKKVKSLSNAMLEKRLCTEIYAMREAITTFEVRSLQHVSTKLMIADGLTKSTFSAPILRKAIVKAMSATFTDSNAGERVSRVHLP